MHLSILLQHIIITGRILNVFLGADPGFFIPKSKFHDLIGNDDVIDGDVRTNDVI